MNEFNIIKEKILSVGSGCTNVFGGNYTGGYLIQQNPDEFANLVCFLKNIDISVYCEIGSASGGNIRFIWENVGFKSAIVIDDMSHPHHNFQASNYSGFESCLIKIEGDSHSEEVKNELYKHKNMFTSQKNKVFFIDGDHYYSGVMKDFELLLPLMCSGDIIIFHDTVACYNDVGGAFRAILNEHPVKKLHEFIGDMKPLGIGVISFL